MSCPCEASRAIACLGRGEAARLLLCLGRYAEHRALLLCLGRAKPRALLAWLCCGVMKRKRSGAKITSQVSAYGRAKSSRFQGGVRHGGIENGKSWRRGDFSRSCPWDKMRQYCVLIWAAVTNPLVKFW